MDQHGSTLRYRVWCWVGIDPTLTIGGRKAIVAMVNIDGSDGRNLWVFLMAPSRASPLPQWIGLDTIFVNTHTPCGSGLAREGGLKSTIDSERTTTATYTQTRGL